MNIIQLLDSPIAFHRCLARITGSAAAGLLLSQAIYWRNVMTRKGHASEWFYKTTEEWMEETMLGPNEFKTARNACKPFLDHEVRGIPAKCFYRINVDALKAKLDEEGSDVTNKFERNVQTGLNESFKQESTNRSNYSTETTSESTAENTTTKPETGARALAPSRKKRSEPSPEARELTNLFAQAYLKHTGNRYVTSEADSKSSMVLLASTGLQCSAIVSVVEKLWASKGWWGKRVVTLKALRDHWNEVQTEVSLGPVSNVPPHVEARKLQATIDRHPANPSWVGHRYETVTAEQKAELKRLEARLQELEGIEE